MQSSSKINRYQHYDANSDRGYGRLEPKFHQPRSFIQYPEAPERDEKAESEIDDETYSAVLTKLLSYSRNDPYAANGTDPFHFVDGATRMAESPSPATGMVPFPRMYKARQAIAGGTGPRGPGGPTASFQTRTRPTGTKKGFSQAPYPEPNPAEIEPAEDFVSIINTDLDQEHVDMIRRMVKFIHLEQE